MIQIKRKKIWAAGGVVLRHSTSNECDVVICGRHSENLWALPKGRPANGETRANVALREVTEETGLVPQIHGEVGEVSYSFKRPINSANGQNLEEILYDKTVFFYLMSSTGGSIEKHDNEYDEVVWEASKVAYKQLTYPTEVSIVKRAIELFKTQALV